MITLLYLFLISFCLTVPQFNPETLTCPEILCLIGITVVTGVLDYLMYKLFKNS